LSYARNAVIGCVRHALACNARAAVGVLAGAERQPRCAVLSLVPGGIDTSSGSAGAGGALGVDASRTTNDDARACSGEAQGQRAVTDAETVRPKIFPGRSAYCGIAPLALIRGVLCSVHIRDAVDDASVEAIPLETDAVGAGGLGFVATLSAYPVATNQTDSAGRFARGRRNARAAAADQVTAALHRVGALIGLLDALRARAGVAKAVAELFLESEEAAVSNMGGHIADVVDTFHACCEVPKADAIGAFHALDTVPLVIFRERGYALAFIANAELVCTALNAITWRWVLAKTAYPADAVAGAEFGAQAAPIAALRIVRAEQEVYAAWWLRGGGRGSRCRGAARSGDALLAAADIAAQRHTASSTVTAVRNIVAGAGCRVANLIETAFIVRIGRTQVRHRKLAVTCNTGVRAAVVFGAGGRVRAAAFLTESGAAGETGWAF